MAFRLYIVPVVGAGTKVSPRRPKYFNSVDGVIAAGATWSAQDYGLEPWMVVAADLSTSDDNLVVGEPDAFALPFDLSTTLSAAQVTSVQTKLEAINLPAGWVATSLTWLQVVRVVLGMFSFMQNYQAVNVGNGGTGQLFTGGVTLATTFGALAAQQRADLATAAANLSLTTNGISGTTTLRVALKTLADQFGARQYNFNGTLI